MDAEPSHNGNGNGTNRLLLLAVGGFAATVVVAIAAIVVFRPSENTLAEIGLITAFATATIASLYAAVSSARTAEKVQTLAVNVDGRLTQLLETTKRAERAEGHIDGVATERERAMDSPPGAPAGTAVVVEKAAHVTIEQTPGTAK